MPWSPEVYTADFNLQVAADCGRRIEKTIAPTENCGLWVKLLGDRSRSPRLLTLPNERTEYFGATENALAVVRISAVLAQTATLMLTWRVWEVRSFPPLLPVLDVPQIAMARPLLASLALVLVRPRLGVLVHVVLLLVAMFLDQTRIQPYIMSCAILMFGAFPEKWPQALACTHLITLWFYAGLHKIVSAINNGMDGRFFMEVMPWLPDQRSAFWLHLVTMSFEVLIAVLALQVRTRRLAAVFAVALHAGIFLSLSFCGQNIAVWPWQLPLAIGGLVFMWSWRASFTQTFLMMGPFLRLLMVFLLVSPLGFYLGLVDPYLSHCLYSNNTPRAWIVSAYGVKKAISSPRTNVTMQPTPRLFKLYFAKVARPGDVLVIENGEDTIRIHADLTP